MPKKTQYKVRTIFLSNYFEPARQMAELRRDLAKSNASSIVAALKRVEIADSALEKELNNVADKGLTLAELLLHPENNKDLIVTAIFSQEVDE
jgi:hypothetical protein